jgi:hypothetical protein
VIWRDLDDGAAFHRQVWSNCHFSPVAKLYRETHAALEMPAVKEALGTLGVDPLPMDTTQFTAFVHSEIGSNAALVHAANITIK